MVSSSHLDISRLGLVEASLEAWDACRPSGHSLRLSELPSMLPRIAAAVPGGLSSPLRAQRLAEIFTGSSDLMNRAPFLPMLKSQDGQVDFLHFWRAFSEATCVVMGCHAVFAPSVRSLGHDLEILRDTLLSLVGTSAGRLRLTIAGPALRNTVHGLLASSVVPEFWREVRRTLGEKAFVGELSIEEVTMRVVGLLRDALTCRWNHDRCKSEALPSQPPQSLPCTPAFGPVLPDGSQRPLEVDALQGDGKVENKDGLLCSAMLEASGEPVYLQVYDVTKDDIIGNLNNLFAHRWSPVKLCGAFHVGVQVGALEWSFGMTGQVVKPGLGCVWPRCHPHHRFRETVYLGCSKYAMEDIVPILVGMVDLWPGKDYDILRRNCCHFADALCLRLGVGRIPPWVQRLARIGEQAENIVVGLLDAFGGGGYASKPDCASSSASTADPEDAAELPSSPSSSGSSSPRGRHSGGSLASKDDVEQRRGSLASKESSWWSTPVEHREESAVKVSASLVSLKQQSHAVPPQPSAGPLRQLIPSVLHSATQQAL